MDKKDIAHIRRQLKVDNDLLTITTIFHVYVMKDSTDIYHHESRPFEMLDRDQQELFMSNFKKVLRGQLDQKLFELTFKQHVEHSSQLILHKGLLSNHDEDWKEQMLLMTEKMLKDHPNERDIVITFIRGEYFQPMKERNETGEESERDAVYAHPFILCSINQTEEPTKEMQFDYVEKEFKYKVEVDPVIDLDRPLFGFFFPAIANGISDVNRILYAAPKANEPDEWFIENVLHGEKITTAKEDKVIFEEVVREVIGDELRPATLAHVYGEIHRTLEEHGEETPPTLDYKDVERVLRESGEQVDADKVKVAYQRFTPDETYELKANNIVPKYNSKSIKINTKVANITISPQDLQYVKQVNKEGKRYIMIEVDEDAEMAGFKMLPEELNE
ncbi:DUF4317 domain-containing protein [Aliibacillus thermotolerans]|uniref:DUF4317 domain-containing protein n=1 Tax=Aliibacillus thermotolerans TaxID=1834418 RepID=A0ABW0U5E9_9BACI|nr:DUF4317 domain-containing protein [Aliibacillus thermotolerans]MDA3130873.1 DUF4317 family protein [Aliibacillus thermotolerans]